MRLQRAFLSDTSVIGTAEPFHLTVYRDRADLAVLDAFERLQDEMLTRHAQVSSMTLVDQADSAIKIPEPVRQRSIELSRKYADRVRGSAVVITAPGLGASMARSFLSGFFLLSNSRMNIKVFSTVADGLGWLQALPGQHEALHALTVTELHRFATEAWTKT